MTDGKYGSIQFRRSGEWTMVYHNGVLVKSGDHYHADEWLAELVGVVLVDDEDGLCIPDGHHPLPTLAEVEAAEADHAERSREAEQLRTEAAQLLADAETLMGKAATR